MIANPSELRNVIPIDPLVIIICMQHALFTMYLTIKMYLLHLFDDGTFPGLASTWTIKKKIRKLASGDIFSSE
jgi:hypothetical protein